MKKTLLSALKHGSGTIFILLSMMLGGSLQAWGWSYQTKESSWSSCSSSFESVSFYATPDAATTTSLDVKVKEPSNAITAFKVWQNDCNGQYMGVSFSSMKCVFRISAKWTSSNMYNTYTVVIPQGKIYITPYGGSAIEMTKGDSFVYTAYVTFPTETYTFSITGDDVSATIDGDNPSAGRPSSVRLNYTGLSSDYKYAKITYDLKTNQVSVSPLRYFAAGEYIYFVNGSGYPYSGGTSNDNWIYSNGSDKIGYADIILKDTGDAEHTYRFSYYSGTEYGSGAVYRAQITTACICKSFVVTRGNTVGGGSEWNHTGDLTYNTTNIAYNTITQTAASGTDWTGNYTSYCNAPTPSTGSASSITATTVTLGATVAAAASNPCTPTYVGVNVYSDSSCETLVTSGQTAFVNYATTYSIGITSLSPKTTYYYKAYAISDAGTTESASSSSFTTGCLSGVATTNPSTSTQTVCLGSATALSVTASGGPDSGYTYQWYYNSTASTTGAVAIPGATSSSYTPAVVGANYYYCGVAATGGYCEVGSEFSGLTTIKGVPVISTSSSTVTNYRPVTLTATGAEVGTWSITSGSGGYLYKKSGTSAMFKGNVGDSGTPVSYTIQGSSNGCNGTVTVTVSKNTDNCE